MAKWAIYAMIISKMEIKINPFDGCSGLTASESKPVNPEANLFFPLKKRILFVITQSEMGGAQRFVRDFVLRMNKAKFRALVAAGTNQGPKVENDELWQELKEAGAEICPLKYLKREIDFWQDLKAIGELKKLIKQWQPQVLFLNSSKAGFLGALAARGFKRPKVIYRIGGWTFNDPWPDWKKNLWIKLEKISARWKDIIVVNNRHDYEQAQQLKIQPRQKLALVYNGLDVYKQNFLPRAEARLKVFEKIARYAGRIFQTETLIGTIANFYPAKGLIYLLKAAAAFKDVPSLAFVIIGEGEERFLLEQEIAREKLEKKVFLLGRLPEARRWLTAFDCLVLPSVKEGFPWVVLEAMAAKVPVVATRVGAVPEIIQDGQNGLLIEPGQPASLTAAVKRLIADDHLRQEFSVQGHQTVLFKFEAEKMVREIEALLTS